MPYSLDSSVTLFSVTITPSKLLFCTGLLGILAISVTLFTPNSIYFPNLLIIALGSTLVGSLIGFLFGFPKTNKRKNGSNEESFEINSNLEEITDWLTKILVGLGLSQLHTAKSHIVSLLEFINKDNDISQSIILFILAYFIIYGFYAGYISSSLYLKSLLDNKYNNAETFIHDVENELENYYGTGKAFVDSNLARFNNSFSFDKLKVLKMLEHLEKKRSEISANAYRNIGLEFFKFHDYNTALEMFIKSASIDNNAHALSNISVTYTKHMNLPKLGEKYLKTALKEHPENALVNYNYACMLLRKNMTEKSFQFLEKSINLDRDEFIEIARNDSIWKVVKENAKFKELVPEFDPED